MDIDGLKTFVAIAELGGFTRAGARLHRSQPAISRRLGLLEQELGAPLFDRLRGRARLTEAGRAFRPHAEAALAALKDGQEAVRDLQSGLSGSLSLALVGTLADTHIVDTLRRFRNRARGVRLELRTASSAEVTDLVRRGEVTLGLRYFFADGADLVTHAAGAEAMLVVAVLSFWFGPPGARGRAVPEWFRKDRRRSTPRSGRRFLDAPCPAALGGLARLAKRSRARLLALVMVLDQFSRNLYRNDARAFAQDAMVARARPNRWWREGGTACGYAARAPVRLPAVEHRGGSSPARTAPWRSSRGWRLYRG